METEGYWWTKALATDIYNALREREGGLPPYLGQSPQLPQRRYMVDWLAMIWEKYQLCATARQLTVSLMDYFMDQFDIEARQMYLVALGCLLVATKFEEQEVNIPRVCDLNKHVPEPFTPQQYLQVELLLLDFFKWNVGLPTSAHFTDYFLQYAQDKVNTINGKVTPASQRLQDHLHKYTTYFLEISMQDPYYRDFRPSHVAAACVVSARICLHITPGLGEQLEKATNYSWTQLSPLVQAMLQTHHEDELQSVPPTPPPTPKHTPPVSSTVLTTPTSSCNTYFIITNPPYQVLTPSPEGPVTVYSLI